MAHGMVVIGTSAGGLDAVCRLLRLLPPDLRLSILVVQHRSPDSDALCDVLQDCSALPVHDVIDKEPITPGNVYLAPPDYHVLVEEDHFSLSVDEPVAYSRPSIDVSLESAADSWGQRLVGVVLTGANRDGARGLRHVRDAGGLALVQTIATAEVDIMPAAAAAAVPEAELLTLEELAARLIQVTEAEPPVRRPA
ncbi:MAG TPA: chemotaxis protein CheB [Longimicrobiales bacterium]|nr:chemotaxis protein CheB [Longimicrobiales bacterium]